MDEKTNQDFIQNEILKARYASGSALSGWGVHFPVPSQRIAPPQDEKNPDLHSGIEPQTPHDGIEWEGYPGDKYRCYWIGNLKIVSNRTMPGYRFVSFDSEGEDQYYYDEKNGDFVTPETIDAIIAKLEHFKRVVFGEGD